MSKEKRTFNATDREGYRWQIEARSIGEKMYEASLYRLGINGRHDVDPDWSNFIIGTEIDINAIMAEYLSDAKMIADAFLKGAK